MKLLSEEYRLVIDDEGSIPKQKAREASRGDNKAISELNILDVHDIAALERTGDVLTTNDTATYENRVFKTIIKVLHLSIKSRKNTYEVPEGIIPG